MTHKITEECVGCTACAKHCPVHAIYGQLKEQHEINEKRCIDCGVCGKVCPKGAVLDQDQRKSVKIPKEEWEKPAINAQECSACGMCVQVCSFDCLEISLPVKKGDLDVFAVLKHPDKCVGCSMCEDICPMGAVAMKGGNSND